MNWIRAIKDFFGRLFFRIGQPFRSLLAPKNPLQEKRPGLIRTLLFPFLFVLWLLYTTFANFLELVIGWTSTRQTRAMLMALPSVIAISLFTFVIVYLYNTKNGALVNTYLLRATKAENIESYDTARMYYQKLLQLDAQNQSYEFLIARSFDNQGNLEEASRRMSKLLSQPDVAGVVNFWFAQKTLEREDLKEDQRWKQCLVYLQEFLKEAPLHREANVLSLEANSTLSQMYFSRELFSDALDYLLQAERNAIVLTEISERSYLALARLQKSIAEIYEREGNRGQKKAYEDASLQSILQAIRHFKQQRLESPHDVEYLLLLSDSYLFQKDFEQASRQIEIALRNDIFRRISPQLRAAQSRILSSWAVDLKLKGKDSLGECIEKVDLALRLDPKNERALAILAEITVANIDEVSLTAKQKLEAAIGDASAPFSVHLILGSHAAAEKNDALAIKHLRQAMLLNPKSTAVINNLAFVLARKQEPRFKEALGLINQALSIIPNNPRFLDTRGNIYIRMKQYELAFHDLEAAEVKIKNNPVLYENLLFLVQELGFDDLYRKKYQKQLDALQVQSVAEN